MTTAIGILAGVFVAVASACGGSESGASDAASDGGAVAAPSEHGVGPIEAFEPGPIDEALAAQGEATFTTMCSACHKMDERYVGPALRDVAERRTPAWIMNMILNPEGMLQEDPEARSLLAQFAVPMANQNLTEEEARAILEYLRTEAGAAGS